MSEVPHQNNHLTSHQRYLIEYQLSSGMTPQEIVDSWNEEFHQRVAPSIQKIYKINELMDQGLSVEPLKTGPKNKTVLTPEKLAEINDIIGSNRYLTNESLAIMVDIPKSTANRGLKILRKKKYKAVITPELNEVHKEQRMTFCQSFLCWNVKF